MFIWKKALLIRWPAFLRSRETHNPKIKMSFEVLKLQNGFTIFCKVSKEANNNNNNFIFSRIKYSNFNQNKNMYTYINTIKQKTLTRTNTQSESVTNLVHNPNNFLTANPSHFRPLYCGNICHKTSLFHIRLQLLMASLGFTAPSPPPPLKFQVPC